MMPIKVLALAVRTAATLVHACSTIDLGCLAGFCFFSADGCRPHQS